MKLKNYGNISWADYIHLITVFLRSPFVALWTFATNLVYYHSICAAKRAALIFVIQLFNTRCNLSQIQYILGTAENRYKTWAKKNNLPITIETLVEDSVIWWIGPKRTDRVVLYVPEIGGAYVVPVTDLPLSYWRRVQLELAKNNYDVGFAVLNYSLIPTAVFPTQIRQASLVLEHIIATGVHPSNLHVVSDSGGGHLLLAALSHLVHPLDSIRKSIPLEAPIRGIYLMSPWVCLTSTSSSYQSNARRDIFDSSTVGACADLVLADIPKCYSSYAEPGNAPDSWFKGFNSIVDRVLMTAGGAEIFRDDIIRFSQTLTRTKSNFTFVLQEDGVHDGPFIDDFDDPKSLSPLIIDWLRAGITGSTGTI